MLDAGCAIGFLVEALRERGVEAWGIDVSEYAIAHVPEPVRPYCSVASVTDELERDYDLIVCIEVLEHLPAGLAARAVENFARHTDNVLLSSTPDDFREPTHLNVQPTDYWVELFGRHGFFRNLDLDAGFLSPQAMHLRRAGQTAVAVARQYERWHWRTATEIRQLRAASLAGVREAAELRAELDLWQARSKASEAALAEWEAWQDRGGWRMFMALVALRSRLAPTGTRRDTVMRTTLRSLAQGLDHVNRLVAARTGGRPATDSRKAVLFLSGAPGDTKRYRCDHQAEQLELLGATVEFAFHGEADLRDAVDRYGVFVLHRVPWGPDVRRFLDEARERGKAVVFDTDDLVFEPKAAQYVAALREMNESERALYLDGLVRYRETLSRSDAVTVSTEPLREYAREVHDRIEVAYNAVSREMVELAEAALRARDVAATGDGAGRAVTLAYLSGTPTHNRDFLEAADAVLWALETYPEVVFLAVGHLSLDPRFERFGPRVQRIPLQPWQRLPEIVAGVDVNLAPLEPSNPFTEAKSCLKYIEAALVGVPTIASARPDFVRAIQPGVNGLLADDAGGWRDAVSSLIESPQRRRTIGRTAYEDVHRHHTTVARARPLYATLASLARDGGDGEREPLTVNWVVRAPIAQTGGGYRNIFRIADHLAGRGHRVRMCVEPIAHLQGLSRSQIEAFLDRHFGPLRLEVVVGHSQLPPADVSIATNWPTAYTVADHPESLFKHYFVQDFEPEFYDASDPLAADARATYDLPLRHVCLGKNLAGRIQEVTGRQGDFVDFALDEPFSLRIAPEDRGDPVRILFFARPGLKRRGYELGVEALRRFHERRPDADIVLFGAREEELGSLPFPARNLGVLDAAELAAAMNEAHVLLSFSLTNISNVPFEGMACGCAVLEADVPTVTEMVAPGSCLLASPDPESVAAQLERLAADAELRHGVARRGAAEMEGRTWQRTGDQFERVLLDACFVRLGGDSPRRPAGGLAAHGQTAG